MKIVTFGEIMGRLTAPGHLRLRQALPGRLEMTFGGAEANVAVSLSTLGAETEFVTALPCNPLADGCVANLKSFGVGTNHIVRGDEGRLGLYFVETGANQRPSQVTYDRSGSTVSLTASAAYDWEQIFDRAGWLHVSGITPAISETAAQATLAAAKRAKLQGLRVSCDLNFRKKLWQWERSKSPQALAEKTMRELLPSVDVVIANEEDCDQILGIRAAETDVESGQIQIERYPDVARQVVQQFPNVSKVAITLRESVSATHNNWGGVLYTAEGDTADFAPVADSGVYRPYQITSIVDRVGGGDSFAAALIFALVTDDLSEPSLAIRFAVAASCLAHSIEGDFNLVSREEIESLMKGSGAGRVVR